MGSCEVSSAGDVAALDGTVERLCRVRSQFPPGPAAASGPAAAGGAEGASGGVAGTEGVADGTALTGCGTAIGPGGCVGGKCCLLATALACCQVTILLGPAELSPGRSWGMEGFVTLC